MGTEAKVEAKVETKTVIELPIAFAQEIVNYIQNRPWGEVNGLMARLIELSKK